MSARNWFLLFAEVRNKTRGHGAVTADQCRAASAALESSVGLFANNFALFRRSWAHLKRTLQGKYEVTHFGGDPTPFEPLKRSRDISLPDGVYINLGELVRVDLVFGDAGSRDVLLPNGAFNGRRFEVRSLTTNSERHEDAAPYLAPASRLPSSETEGTSALEAVGQTFSNIPPVPSDYIDRPELQDALKEKLVSPHRYPIVTLTGRGGIGKTSVALRVLRDIAIEGGYFAILWFSARDVDLKPEGPKPVRPQVVAVDDVSREYRRLMDVDKTDEGMGLSDSLEESPYGEPLLFVFDNFETVQSPSELFKWVDSYVRPPNKVLITTRIRDFKGDYPLQVHGMKEEEARELIDSTARRLGISDLLSESYVRNLIDEADGHPYIIKILLGEVAKNGQAGSIRRAVADRDEVLTALFERTYADLTPLAKRVFLTICKWRSAIPELALKAVLLRNAEEQLDIGGALEELDRVSFIDVLESDGGDTFVSAPLSAAAFGRQKLQASPFNGVVEADAQLLYDFGAAGRLEVKQGVTPRVERFVHNVRRRVRDGDVTVEEVAPLLDYLARSHPPSWPILADLYQESSDEERALGALRRYIESRPAEGERLASWRRIYRLVENDGRTNEELQALAEIASSPEAEFHEANDAGQRINKLLGERGQEVDQFEREHLIRKAASALSVRLDEGRASDCSNVAWLYMNVGDKEAAKEIVEKGLALDVQNRHCRNLAEQLEIRV